MSRIYLSHLKPWLVTPLEDPVYLGLLWVYPTLKDYILRKVSDVLNRQYTPINFADLNDNLWLFPEEGLENIKKLIIDCLEELERSTQESKSIYIVCDDCFTNTLMIQVIKNILWESNFNKFVEIVNIDLQKECDNSVFDKIWSNKLIIQWWSLSDTNTMHPSYYSSSLAKIIRDTSDENENNCRFVGICHWNQYASIEVWIKSSSFVITTKWPAQFWPSICSINPHMNPVYSNLLAWLTDFWSNNRFSAFFTRTWHIVDTLLVWFSGIEPLIMDDLTGGCVWYGTRNWDVLWVQFHPEIPFLMDPKFLIENIKEILPLLEWSYNNPWRLIENFDFEKLQGIVKRDIAEPFYVFVLHNFLKSIRDRHVANEKHKAFLESNKRETDYDIAIRMVINNIRSRVNMTVDSWEIFNQWLSKSFLLRINGSEKLLLNHFLDRKVNRWIEEVSLMLWIKDLWELVDAQKIFLKSLSNNDRIYYFVDLGAWDGTLLKDLYLRLKDQNIVFYGVADNIYIDIYWPLKEKWNSLWIPEEVIILFLETFLSNFSRTNGSLYKRLWEALETTDISWINTIHYSSIVSEITHMFSTEREEALSETSIKYIKDNPYIVDELKVFLLENIFKLSNWYFERIYLSTFKDFFSQFNIWTNIDFQTAIKSTSLLYSAEYLQILTYYTRYFANPWSLFMDNWVHMSYTSIPRIMELYEVAKKSWDSIRISLIYDKDRNYFTSAAIEKTPFHDDDFIRSRLRDNQELVSLEEATNATFFQLEYFVRNFISINFMTYDVFRDFKDYIVEAFKEIAKNLKNNDKDKIKLIILNLINNIATNYKSDSIICNLVDMETLLSFSIWWRTLNSILIWDICTPNWLNLWANRKY